MAMPVRHGSYASNTVHPIFAMNLPEGEQFHRIRTRFAKQFSKLDEVIERIAQAMTEALRECKSLFPQAFCQRMAAEWDAGRTTMRA
jgi:hypothetical protein